jgi:tRNA G18 (ribose-2'-O)-methylase SpoU
MSTKEIIVVLHNIRSVYNTASIFRTADGAGVKKIYLCGTTPAPTDVFGKMRLQFAKVSLGAEKFVEWDGSTSLTTSGSTRPFDKTQDKSPRAVLKLLEKLRGDGYKIFAVEQNRKSVPYYKAMPFGSAPVRGPERPLRASRRQGKNKSKVALIFGNEVRGLPPSVLKLADKILEIPMRGAMVRQAHHPRRIGRGKESLNVSVAAGIVLYHFVSGLLGN